MVGPPPLPPTDDEDAYPACSADSRLAVLLLLLLVGLDDEDEAVVDLDGLLERERLGPGPEVSELGLMSFC